MGGQLIPRETLSEAIGNWLEEILPKTISMERLANGAIRLRGSSGQWEVFDPGSLLDSEDRSDDAADSSDKTFGLRIALNSVLSGVQDFVIEELRDPWPPTTTGDLALPMIEITSSGECYAGFAVGERFVLRMPKLDVGAT